MTVHASTRKPAVSGLFYPAEPDILEGRIRALLDRAESPVEAGLPKALVVPHAGYPYSGEVAASAFSLLKHWNCSIHQVALLGPSHHYAFDGMAIPSSQAFATPLGEIPLAADVLSMLEEFPFVRRDDAMHTLEHSLEVELPFLQMVLPSFSLIPLVTGDATAEQVASVLESLWELGETIIIISTDLSHFHDYTSARQLDAFTSKAVEDLDHEILHANLACGFVALRGMLLAAKQHGLGVRALKRMNSGDVAGDRNRVVGYGAWAFYEN